MKIAEFGGDVITNTVVNAMLEKSNVLGLAEFYPMVGNADYTRKASSASGGQFREINSNYPNNQVNPQFANPTLKIFGDQVQTDRAHERRGSDIASVRASDLLTFAYALGKEFQNAFFNGDTTVDAKQFSGLKKIVPAGQIIEAGTDGLAVTLGNATAEKKTQQQFLELLDSLVQSIDGGAQALCMDGQLLSRLSTIARDQVSFQLNEFGQQVAFYNGIPILSAGFDKNGSKILPFSEIQGVNNDTTSVYAFRFGEKEDLSFATNVGVEVKDLGLVGVHYTYSVDFDLDLVLLNNRAAARLKGIRLG